ncbi:MAG TPA: hypothetical protein VGZ23_00330 [bacterium]|nr:hypothetical protein [bacterium]
MTQGETQDEALANAADAIHLYVDSLRHRKLPIPDDTEVTIEEVRIPA